MNKFLSYNCFAVFRITLTSASLSYSLKRFLPSVLHKHQSGSLALAVNCSVVDNLSRLCSCGLTSPCTAGP